MKNLFLHFIISVIISKRIAISSLSPTITTRPISIRVMFFIPAKFLAKFLGIVVHVLPFNLSKNKIDAISLNLVPL